MTATAVSKTGFMEILGIDQVDRSGGAARRRTAIFNGCEGAATKNVGRYPRTKTGTDLVRQRSEVAKEVSRRLDVSGSWRTLEARCGRFLYTRLERRMIDGPLEGDNRHGACAGRNSGVARHSAARIRCVAVLMFGSAGGAVCFQTSGILGQVAVAVLMRSAGMAGLDRCVVSLPTARCHGATRNAPTRACHRKGEHGQKNHKGAKRTHHNGSQNMDVAGNGKRQSGATGEGRWMRLKDHKNVDTKRSRTPGAHCKLIRRRPRFCGDLVAIASPANCLERRKDQAVGRLIRYCAARKRVFRAANEKLHRVYVP